MALEQLLFILESIESAIGGNIDLFFINTSVFFFANTYMQSRKSWEYNLKKTTAPRLTWDTLAYFKENPNIGITEKTMQDHPEWTVILGTHPIPKELTTAQYKIYLEYERYDESYEVKYAGEKKDRYAAFYGAALLILGTFFSLQKNCGNVIVAVSVLLIYILMAVIIIKTFLYGVEPMTKVRARPEQPSFLDE